MYQFSLFSENGRCFQEAEQQTQKESPNTTTSPCKIISFIPISDPKPAQEPKKRESRKGKTQKVYPLKRYDDLIAMANWLYENKDKKYVLAFIIGINIGLRANELLSLRMSQVFNPDGTVRCVFDGYDTNDVIYIYQGKTDKNRPIFLNQACKDALEWYFPVRGSGLHCNKYLFPSREGGAIEVDTFRKVLKEAAEANGIKQNIGTHTLRKTFGFYLYTQTPVQHTDITSIQALYGHSSPDITMRYVGLDEIEFKSMYHRLQLNIVKDEHFAGMGQKDESHDTVIS